MLIPGDPERAKRAEVAKNGVNLSQTICDQQQISISLSVPVPQPELARRKHEKRFQVLDFQKATHAASKTANQSRALQPSNNRFAFMQLVRALSSYLDIGRITSAMPIGADKIAGAPASRR